MRFHRHVLLLSVVAVLLAAPAARAQEVKVTKEEWDKVRNQFGATFAAATDTPSKVAAVKLLEPVLGHLQDSRWEIDALNLLLNVALKETDDAVVDAALDCIGLISHPMAVANLANKTGDVRASPLRLKLARLFGKMCFEDFVKPLSAYLDDADLEVVAASLESLAMLSSNEAMSSVIAGMRSGNGKVKHAALEAVRKSADPRFAAELIKMLKSDRDKEVKAAALEILKILSGQDFGFDGGKWSEWFRKVSKSPVEKVNQELIDKALEKGGNWLKTSGAMEKQKVLVIYTLIHAGVKADDPVMKEGIAFLESMPLTKTYHTAIAAMCLHDLDKVKFRKRLAECAYFLMGNQDPKGYWRYGEPVDGFEPPEIPTTPPEEIETGGKETPREGTGAEKERKPTKIKIKLPPRRTVVDWDNSNSQYAVLGLRACADGGILIPVEVWRDAEQHFLSCQNQDGGWHYRQGVSYGSMTAGGISSLAICKYYQGKQWKNAPEIRRGIEWLEKNFTVTANPQFPLSKKWHYYYLYGLERAGILAGTEYIGSYEWYPIGARWLISTQDQATGAWNNDALDTCFAILFLRRATERIPVPKEIETGSKPKETPKD